MWIWFNFCQCNKCAGYSNHSTINVAVCNIFLVKMFLFLWGKKILHEWRHVTKHDDVWLRYKRKESTRSARAGIWEHYRFCQCYRNTTVPLMFVPPRVGVRRGHWQPQLQRTVIFKSGGSVNLNGVGVVMLSVHAFASPLTSWPLLASWVSHIASNIHVRQGNQILTRIGFQTKRVRFSHMYVFFLFWKLLPEMLSVVGMKWQRLGPYYAEMAANLLYTLVSCE